MKDSILIQDISKYNKKRRCFDHITMEIPAQSRFAIIGPLESGKSSLLSMIAGLKIPTSGTILFPDKIRPKMGTFIDGRGFFEKLTVEDNLRYKKTVLGIPQSDFVEEYLKRFDLSDIAKIKVEALAHEHKIRLGLALSMMGGPDLLLLDDIFDSLSYAEVNRVKQLILDYQLHTGCTVVFTAKEQQGLEDFATHYVSLSGGQIKKAVSKEKFEAELPGYIKLSCEPLSEAKQVLNQMNIFSYQTKSDYMIYIFERFEDVELIRQKLEEANIHVSEITLVKENGLL